jgi:hypothetical protein
MSNPSDILGGLLQGGLGGPGMDRLGHAMGERGLGAPGGPLGQILGQLGAAGGGYSPPGGGGGLAEAVDEALGRLEAALRARAASGRQPEARVEP